MSRQRALLTQHSSGQVPASRPGCCACYWTWRCQVDYLLLVTSLSLRGLKDTWDFWLCRAWLFLKRCWVHQAGKTWAGTSSPWPWHGEACLCPKPLITVAREPGACSLLQGVGRALLCQLPQPPSPASALRRKRPLLARGKQLRLLGTMSRTSFGGETCKEARIKLFKADAFLFIQRFR